MTAKAPPKPPPVWKSSPIIKDGLPDKPAPPAPPSAPAKCAKPKKVDGGRFTVTEGPQSHGERIMLFGEGKVGKTSLVALAPDPLFIDLEGGTDNLDVVRVGGVESWSDLMDLLASNVCHSAKTIVVDSITYAMDLCARHIVQKKGPSSKKSIESIVDWGWGDGEAMVYDEMLHLLKALEKHTAEGRNIILIAHECQQRVSDPGFTDDFTQYQPRLPNHNKGNVRARIKEWVDHLFFYNFDKSVAHGKAKGAGTRTLYLSPQAHFWAGSRTLNGVRPIAEGDGSIWKELFDHGIS